MGLEPVMKCKLEPSYTAIMNEGCFLFSGAFDLLVYTRKDCKIPDTWDDSAPCFINNCQEVRLKSFSTSVHKIQAAVAYKMDWTCHSLQWLRVGKMYNLLKHVILDDIFEILILFLGIGRCHYSVEWLLLIND